MKIVPNQVDSWIARGQILRMVLVYGPDRGLILERAQALFKHFSASPDTFESKQIQSDCAYFFQSCLTPSLFEPQKLLWLRDADDGMTSILKEVQTKYADAIDLLVITAGDLAPRSSLRKWAETAEDVACIACYADTERDLLQLFQKHLQQSKIKAGHDVLQYMAKHMGQDRQQTLQELDKIITYAVDQQRIEMDDLTALGIDAGRIETESLLYTALFLHSSTFAQDYKRLVDSGETSISIIRHFLWHLRRILQVQILLESGVSMDQALSQLKPPLFFKSKTNFVQAVTKIKPKQIIEYIGDLTDAELMCKTSGVVSETALAWALGHFRR